MSKRIIKNKTLISEGKYVVKNTDKDLRVLFDYLDKRSFDNYPKILEIDERSVKTEYIKDDSFGSRENDLIEVVSNLHYKTTDYKDVSKNKYKEIYEKINSNIEYLMNYYNKLMTSIESSIYFSPSEYMLARNFSIINSSLNYCKETLDEWFRIVENKTKERVVVVHNNLKSEHLLRSDKNYLINWDKYLVDTPVLDLYKFYTNEGFKLDFAALFNIYNENFKLTEEEKKMLFLLIKMPKKIEMMSDERLSTYNIKTIMDALYKANSTVDSLS